MNNNSISASFIERFLAYIIDFIVVFFIASLISLPFVDREALIKINNDINDVSEQAVNGNIDVKTYNVESSVLLLEYGKISGTVVFITTIIKIIYFIIFQFYNSGQTIGKKIFKIKVISNDGDLTMNALIFRSLFINFILLYMVQLILVSFVKNPVQYLSLFGLFEWIYIILLMIDVFMILFGKNKKGLHDFVTNSNVVKI